MTTDQSQPEDDRPDAVFAAEYALHLLSAEDRSRAETRIGTDGAFRALVAEWLEDLAPMAEAVDPVTPPKGIRRRLAKHVSGRSGGVSFGRFLSGAFGGAAVAAAALVLLVVALPQGLVREPAVQLASAESDLVVDVSINAEDHVLTLTRASGAAPEGRVLQLWLLPEGADTPVALGLLDPDDPVSRIQVSDETAPGVSGGLLEISEEPPGGSPTGLPTGEVLAIGRVGGD